MSINVLHYVNDLSVSSGGPSRTVSALCSELAKHEWIKVTLMHQQLRQQEYIKPSSEVRLVTTSTNSRPLHLLGTPSLKALKNENAPDLVHVHGLWSIPTARIARYAIKRRIPLVIQPRGMLEPWALNYKRTKKDLALKIYQGSILRAADAFVATSLMEHDSIRSFGLSQPVAVIPNGTIFPALSPRQSKIESQMNALFISRIHPKKGLIDLIEAWSIVRPTGWKLTIAGPDEENHRNQLEALVRQHSLQSSVSIIGEVEGHVKSQLFQESDLFIFPSYSENFGVVVLEAMSYGLPVIATNGTPWRALEQHHCGWWIDPGLNSLTQTLRFACSLSRRELSEMGVRGIDLAKQFQWPSIGQSTGEFYKWILGQTTTPNFVNIQE